MKRLYTVVPKDKPGFMCCECAPCESCCLSKITAAVWFVCVSVSALAVHCFFCFVFNLTVNDQGWVYSSPVPSFWPGFPSWWCPLVDHEAFFYNPKFVNNSHVAGNQKSSSDLSILASCQQGGERSDSPFAFVVVSMP